MLWRLPRRLTSWCQCRSLENGHEYLSGSSELVDGRGGDVQRWIVRRRACVRMIDVNQARRAGLYQLCGGCQVLWSRRRLRGSSKDPHAAAL